MDELVDLWETPIDQENVMIVGWQQWADAGECSSGLPHYLIEQVGAHKIGEIKSDGFYLFQIPGTHHLMRPQVKLNQGYREHMSTHTNEIYFAMVNGKGLFIFAGEEPHQHERRYAEAFFDMVEALNIRRVVAVGGVFGAMPYGKDREISCVYSVPKLKPELDNYAVRFSDYEGGSTIGTFMAHWAEFREVEFVVFYAFAPAYEFSQLGLTIQSMRVDEDWKAWFDLLRRIDFMLGLGLDLTDLEERGHDLIEAWDAKIEETEKKHPDLHVKAYLEAVSADFTERPFIPLDKAWDELGDLLGDIDDET